MKFVFRSLLFVVLLSSMGFGQRQLGVKPSETGGPLKFEQAVFDVLSYEVNITATPATKSIAGLTIMRAKTVIPTNVILLDLDTPYTIENVSDGKTDLKYERKGDKIWIWFPSTKQVGDEIRTQIRYAGVPKIAPNPPWVGGFIWTKTPNGADWISVALQNDGADLMFPCKDHPSDKPATAMMNISVPNGLVAVGPGKFVGTKKPNNEYTTYSWRMTNPIANYSLVFNAAPYKLIEDSVKSITGEMIPIKFYILPESFDKGAKLIDETKKYNAFYEKYLGPFPFRSQKLGIVETPHLGMEHSTALAYGNKFQYNADGYDWLQLHEFGHEWWANLVTASDWRDFWIHEGFQSFMDSLYLEHLGKKDAYFTAMKNRARGFKNKQPVAPREAKIAYQVYMSEPDYLNSDGDIYGKGAYFLHTLRYLIGDAAFFKALRHMSYPSKELERLTDGRQQRLVNTDDFLTIAEADSGMELDWLFEMYLRQPKLPKLLVAAPVDCTSNCPMELRWETPNDMPFPMPIDVEIDGRIQRLEMRGGSGTISDSGKRILFDPKGWILKTP